MINIEQLKESDTGRWVKYTNSAGMSEIGRIKSWNERFVFVVYKCGGEWSCFTAFTGQATKPEDLDWFPNDKQAQNTNGA